MNLKTVFDFKEENRGDHQRVLESPLFMNWFEKASKEFFIESIRFQSADFVKRDSNPYLLFLKLKATAFLDKTCTKKVPGVVFLRGGAVAILVVLNAPSGKYLLLVNQPRFGVTFSACPEIPAGMLDGDANIFGVATRELAEETGLKIHPFDLFDLHTHYYGNVHPGIYSSVGVSDEYIRLLLLEKDVSEDDLKELGGQQFSNPAEHEHIHTRIIKVEEGESVLTDTKSLLALSLYKRLCAERNL